MQIRILAQWKALCLFFLLTVTGVNSFAQNVTVNPGAGSYPTLKAAFDAVNAGTHTGAVTIDLLLGTTETATAALNASGTGSASYTSVVITTTNAAGVVVEGSLASAAIINLIGADNVTIDGRISGTGRKITVKNSSATVNATCIWLSHGTSATDTLGAQNNTIRNCEILCDLAVSASISNTFGILAGSSVIGISAGRNNDNNRFLENRIVKCRYGILLHGGAANSQSDGNTITGNIIGPDVAGPESIGKAGIFVQFQNNCLISQNLVQNVGGTFTGAPTGTDRVGIAAGTDAWSTTPGTTTGGNYTITRNKIHAIKDERTFSAIGIICASTRGGAPTNNIITNNEIYDVLANATSPDGAWGIGHSGNDGLDLIAYNSIYMVGDLDPAPTATATQTHGGIRVAVAADGLITIKNNSVFVDLTSNTAALLKVCIQMPSTSYNFGTAEMDNNNYYYPVTNPEMRLGALGTTSLASSFVTDLAAWKTTFTPVNQDANSVSADPLYALTPPHYLSPLASSPLFLKADPIAGITTDILAVTRSATTPTIGAYETIFVACTPPVISCPGNVTVSNDPGICSAVVAYPPATATGTSPTITYSQNSGTPFPVGTTTVTATATNGCGTSSCTFDVTVNAADINVKGNAVTIADGDVTPALADHTDFGDVNLGGNIVRTFTIENTGTANLAVSGITMNGTDASLFAVGTLTPASPILPNGSATFTVTFAPTTAGTKTAAVNIASEDCDETTYNYDVQGNGTCATPVTINTTSLPAGTEGSPYLFTLSVTGGSGSYTYMQFGTLPTGMSFANGTFSGTPTQNGNFGLAVNITDDAGCPTEGGREYNLLINPAVSCSTVTNRLYVDASAAPGGTGAGWPCALQELSTAISMANANPAITSIWVADGTYKPTTGTSRTAVMAITRANLLILGGFAGGEVNAADANPAVNLTIISGDIGVANDMSDNSYRLMNIGGSPVTPNALVVDGFIFEKGNANGSGDNAVGAAILSNAIPVATPVQINRCTFRNNNAVSNGGAVYLTGSNLAFAGCRFADNTAGNAGGAVFTFQASPTFLSTIFAANTAPNGGGYYGNYGYPVFSKTVFTGNSATYGGGVYQNRMNADYLNCVFNANTSYQGGAIYEQNASFSHIVNSTFFKNTGVSYGGAIVLSGSNSRTTTENSIFWKNTYAGSATTPWSDFVNYTAGANVYANNILQLNTAIPADNGTTRRNNTRGTDPLFFNEANVPGLDGIWATADDGLELTLSSPALNTGDNALVVGTTDIKNSPRIACSVADKGCAELQNCFSVSPPATPEFASLQEIVTGPGATGIVVNPFSNDLKIRYSGAEKAAVTVYSVVGKQMWSRNNIAEGITHVDAGSWSRGMYQVVLVTASGKKMTFKVVRL
ncbi:MAG: choice-of-anchor D domain-containing protein [Bacteroidota bacterium]